MTLLTRVRVVVAMTTSHNAHPTAKINKVKDLALTFFDQCLYSIKTSSAVKNVLSKRFSVYFFHSHQFNEMFIVNDKSHCCNDTFTDVRFTLLLTKNV